MHPKNRRRARKRLRNPLDGGTKVSRTIVATALAFLVAISTLVSGCTKESGAQSSDTFKAGLLDGACNAPEGTDRATKDFAQQTCSSYLRGLTDGLFLFKSFSDSGRAGCLPSDAPISVADAEKELRDYLREHPARADNSAGIVATDAIMSAHPCLPQQ